MGLFPCRGEYALSLFLAGTVIPVPILLWVFPELKGG